jgi:DNA-directed RNA polymerase omega subunit
MLWKSISVKKNNKTTYKFEGDLSAMMIKPTIQDLTKGKYNRYELALATAKGARLITDEYVRQRTEAERAAGVKEGERPIGAMIDKELKDEKAVRLAIDRISEGEYVIVEEIPQDN